MECLRSFTINIRQNTTFGTPEIDTWSDLGNTFFTLNTSNNFSRFNIQGFKNVDIYGVDVIGAVEHQTAATGFGALVTDWSFDIFINGQLPLVSGNIQTSPNYWNITATTNEPKVYRLSKNTNSVKLTSPLKSVSYIEFSGLFAQGMGVENINAIGLSWHLDFIFYYKYEGE
jgi:hypothetical protein